MKTPFTVEELTNWVKIIKQCAADDEGFKTAVFPGTVNTELSIVGGWKSGFNASYADLLCISHSDDTQAMCIKIVKNPGFTKLTQFAARDFGCFELPTCLGMEEDTCIALELEDDPAAVADFYASEWERLTIQQEALAV